MNNFSLTAIVPYFNEKLTLEESVNRLNKIKIIEKIILVDDCSIDDSKIIGQILSDKIQKVVYKKTTKNLGKGGAVLFSLTDIETSHVVIHDADLEYDPNDIYEMFNINEDNNSIVIGSRFLNNKTKRLQNMGLTLNLIEIFSTRLFNKIFNTSLTDIGSCYKLIPYNFLIETTFKEKGFFLEIEFLSKFLENGGKILEVPINYFGRSKLEGKKNNIKIMIKFYFKVLSLGFKKFKF